MSPQCSLHNVTRTFHHKCRQVGIADESHVQHAPISDRCLYSLTHLKMTRVHDTPDFVVQAVNDHVVNIRNSVDWDDRWCVSAEVELGHAYSHLYEFFHQPSLLEKRVAIARLVYANEKTSLYKAPYLFEVGTALEVAGRGEKDPSKLKAAKAPIKLARAEFFNTGDADNVAVADAALRRRHAEPAVTYWR